MVIYDRGTLGYKAHNVTIMENIFLLKPQMKNEKLLKVFQDFILCCMIFNIFHTGVT